MTINPYLTGYLLFFRRKNYKKNCRQNERLKKFKEEEDQALIAQLFQFGRYLMIAGSRGEGQPLNLQGLWNDQVLPPWNSGYTLNINLEMNYLASQESPTYQNVTSLYSNSLKK